VSDDQSYAGSQTLASGTSESNMLDFVVRSIMGRQATATLVIVKAVTNTGDVAAVGLLDVQPMVAQLDGHGKPVDHGVIHNVPYARVQGGTAAIIIDPKVGDIGIAIFASRDISAVKNSKKPSNPGSRRSYDWADALYVGGVLNGVPEQYIRFTSAGDIEIKPASKVTVMGDVQVNGTLTASTDVVAAGKSLKTHIHTGVQTGGGVSGPPQ
jgi:hypothetical protein